MRPSVAEFGTRAIRSRPNRSRVELGSEHSWSTRQHRRPAHHRHRPPDPNPGGHVCHGVFDPPPDALTIPWLYLAAVTVRAASGRTWGVGQRWFGSGGLVAGQRDHNTY